VNDKRQVILDIIIDSVLLAVFGIAMMLLVMLIIEQFGAGVRP
jgi:ABC-type bacteriocin/lantibiotic exporter with double-glycine peptidase domain